MPGCNFQGGPLIRANGTYRILPLGAHCSVPLVPLTTFQELGTKASLSSLAINKMDKYMNF